MEEQKSSALMSVHYKDFVGCQICESLRNREFDLLAQVQFKIWTEGKSYMEESHMDAVCDQHLGKLNRISTAKTMARLLRFLIGRSLNGNLMRYSREKCPICRELCTMEDEEISKAALGPFNSVKGDFICVSHLEKLLRKVPSEVHGEILHLYAKSLQKLDNQLKVLEEKGYYASEREIRSSLWRAVEILQAKK
jgi:hypothetical protein